MGLTIWDTNARTKDVNDFIENDEVEDYLPIDDQYQPDLNLNKRINADNCDLNTNDSTMIDFCKSEWQSRSGKFFWLYTLFKQGQ